jgi:hypothetical protein
MHVEPFQRNPRLHRHSVCEMNSPIEFYIDVQSIKQLSPIQKNLSIQKQAEFPFLLPVVYENSVQTIRQDDVVLSHKKLSIQ